MKIVCPQCTFGRDIPDDRLPGKAVVATCPRCKHRFRVCANASDADGEQSTMPPQAAGNSVAPASGTPLSTAPHATGQHDPTNGDDPLPPGAIIPRGDADDYQSPVTPPRPPEASPRRTEPTQFEADMEAQRRASEAYTRQSAASAEQEEIDNFALDNPWENPQFGYPAAFYQTAMRVMFAAPRFFAGLMPVASHVRPLLFYLVVGVLQIIVERVWGRILSSVMAPAASTDPDLQVLLQMLDPDTSLFLTVLLRTAMITLQLFLAAGLFHLAFRLFVPTRANFSLVFQVLAYSSAPALLCIVPVAGSIVGFIWGLACSFIGCRYALRLTMQQTVIALAPLLLLTLPMIMLLARSVSSVTG